METKAMQKNPVIQTAKWIVSLMKNQIVLSLIIMIQGVLFIIAPEGDMTTTVFIGAIILIAAALINIGIHLIPKERKKIDVFLAVINMLLIAAAVFCLVTPATVEPFVRGFFAVITIIGNLINLIEVFKLEKKRSLRFFIGLIVAIIMIGLGITMLMASKEVIEAMQQGIGIFLIVNSLINIWYILRLHFAAKRLKQNAKESYVLSDNQSV